VIEHVDAGWSVHEFRGLDLGDERLNRRLLVLAEAFGARPTAPINQASDDWYATKAAYGFFANPKATPAELLAPHQECTLERMQAHNLVLLAQDTTFFNYTHHPATAGLGPIGGGQRGLVMHSTLAFTPQGLPLGVLAQQIWARPEPQAAKPKRTRRPISEKESRKWLQALHETVTLVPEEIRLVTIADREADIFEFLDHADQLAASSVILAAQDRRVGGELARLWMHMAAQEVVGNVTVTVAARAGQAERTADLRVRVGQVTLQPPLRPADDPGVWLEPLTIWAIWLHEDTPPATATPIEWLLLTNVAVQTWQDATERIAWYCVRPQIEQFHKILKSGCTVEDCRLEHAERLKPYLTLMSVVAWRLFWLTYINRQTPEAPCTAILAEHEWQALYATIYRTTILPDWLPTVRQAVRWIAQLGGFLGRKGDGELGITSIWRGWSRLTDIANMYRMLHASEGNSNS
jgi:Transposase DNA-binding/Transposase Tn5 dimerisation domain